MKRIICMILTMASGFSFANEFYYGKPARLEGKVQIIKSLHPNQEVFGGNQIAIALNHSISVDGDDGLIKTKLIQLVDENNTRYNRYFKSNYKEIIVDCSELFRGHTAHHTTKVLCVVESVKYK